MTHRCGLLLLLLIAGRQYTGEPIVITGQPMLFFVVCPATELLALPGQDEIASARGGLDCRLSSERYLLGEPVSVEVILRWEHPDPEIALITSPAFLEIEFLTEDGTRLVTPSGWEELYSEYDGDCKWCDGTIILTSENPEWRSKIRLDLRYRLDAPGAYIVIVRWGSPPNKEGKIDPRILKKTQNGLTPQLLEGFFVETSAEVKLLCPEEDIDRKAFELLTGGACPESYMPFRTLVAESERLSDLLQRFPTSAYAGFAIARRLPDLEDWRIKVGKPHELVRMIKAMGPRKELSTKNE